MKKIVFVAAFAALAFAGCQKEVSFETPQTNDIVLTAISDNYPESKTVLDGAKVFWNNGDCIAVYNGSAVAEFSTAAADKSATADFTTNNAEFAAAENYLAVYPYSDGLAFADGKVTVTVPASQTATSGGFDPKANVAVASGAADALQFKNVCSYLKFTVPANMTDLSKVVLSAKGGEALAGSVKADCANASFDVVGEGASSATLQGNFEAGKSYYIAVLPGTLSQGFTLTMTRSGETSTMTTKTSFTFTRSRSANIGELYDGTWRVALEGCNVPAGTVMVNTGDGYCVFNGNLSAGKLEMRVLYENITLGSVNIPANGWYHIILNINEKTYKVYNQAVYVDLGNWGLANAPWTNVDSAKASSVTLNDYNGNDSGLKLTVGSGFKLYDSATEEDERGNYAYKGDILLMKVWYDGLYFSGADKNTNSDVKNITISGLELSATYDVRIVSVRFNGSKTARKTKLSINGSDAVTIQQGIKIDKSVGTEAYLNYEAVPINEYVAEFNDVNPTADGKLEISVQAIATGKASDAHVNAIQIFRKL